MGEIETKAYIVLREQAGRGSFRPYDGENVATLARAWAVWPCRNGTTVCDGSYMRHYGAAEPRLAHQGRLMPPSINSVAPVM